MARHTLKIFKVLDHFGTLCIKGLKLRSNKLNPLSANFTKWSNTLKQFVGKLQMNCFTVFDHFVGLALKGLSIDLLFSYSDKPAVLVFVLSILQMFVCRELLLQNKSCE